MKKSWLARGSHSSQKKKGIAKELAEPESLPRIEIRTELEVEMARGRLGCLPIVGVFIIAGVVGGIINGTNSSSESPEATATSPTPTATRSQNSATSTKPADCRAIEINVTMVRNLFEDGTANTSQASAILNAAADEWAQLASQNSGSRADWLNKMAELSLDLEGYVTNGSPSNGETLLDQLYANFGLLNQFC